MKPFREPDLAIENERLRARVAELEAQLGAELSDMVEFNGYCPACGSNKRTHPLRKYVPAKDRLFWQPAVSAHFKAECAGCGMKFRELLKPDGPDETDETDDTDETKETK